MKNKESIKYITVVAMFAALAYAAMLLGKLVPNVAGFLSYDPKDAVIVIAGFILGPAAAALLSLLVSAIEMITVSGTGFYGLLMNVISTCAFALPAVIVYKKKRTRWGAVAGLLCGVAVMAAVMVLWNYIITPIYMNVPRETVAGMLLPVFLPFNLVKGGINAVIAFLVYKPVVGALRKSGLVKESESGAKSRFGLVPTLIALEVLATLVLLLLVLVKGI